MPDGFEDVSSGEYQELEANGQLRVVTPGQFLEDQKQEDALAAQDQQEIEAFIAQAKADNIALPPKLEELLLGEPEVVPGELEKTGDGNYRLFVNKPDSPQNPVRILLGKRAMNRMVADAIRKFKTRENQIGIITKIYDAIPADQASVYAELGLPPTVDALQALSVNELIGIYEKIADSHETIKSTLVIPPGFPPAGHVSDCKLESGYPAASPKAGELIISELNASKCGTPDPAGIFSKYIWPLKWNATCVKDQADRGTCTAFAIAGAMEVMATKKYNKWTNLSEQDLYYQIKTRWWPTLYGDGSMTSDIWKKVIADNYKVPFESYWPYNPSFNRVDLEEQQVYQKSCKSSSESYADDFAHPSTKQYCSETAGQGRAVCTKIGPFQFCAYATPVDPKNGYFSGYRVKQAWHVLNHLKPTPPVDFARTLLAAGYPMTLLFGVPSGFSNTLSYDDSPHPGLGEFRGMVRYSPSAKIVGGHAVLVTGSITNEELAQIMPGVWPGEGGGYFIVKNSWSTCWGDAGYGYIPFAFVETFGVEMTVLEEIE